VRQVTTDRKLMAKYRKQAEQMVERDWAMIQKLAFALFERKRMERPEIEDVLGISIGSGGQLRSDSRGLSVGSNDKHLECVRCHEHFLWSQGSQEFFASNGWVPPKRCPACRKERGAHLSRVYCACASAMQGIHPAPILCALELRNCGFEFPAGGFMPEKKSLLNKVLRRKKFVRWNTDVDEEDVKGINYEDFNIPPAV
jgi:hypothetical protein